MKRPSPTPDAAGRVQEVDRILVDAAADASEATASVLELSSARLEQLSRLPVDERVALIDDPTLTEDDRARLKTSLSRSLSSSATRKPPETRVHPAGTRDHLWLLPRKIGHLDPRLWVPLVFSGLVAGLAWFNTASAIELAVPVIIVPETTAEPGEPTELSPGITVAVVRRRGMPIARVWDPRKGYLHFSFQSNAAGRGE